MCTDLLFSFSSACLVSDHKILLKFISDILEHDGITRKKGKKQEVSDMLEAMHKIHKTGSHSLTPPPESYRRSRTTQVD